MRFLITAKFDCDEFNESVRDGTAGETIQDILDDLKPEAAYFTEFDGQRTAVLIVDVVKASEIPRYAEPFYLNWDAEVAFHPVMLPHEVAEAGLEDLADKWS